METTFEIIEKPLTGRGTVPMEEQFPGKTIISIGKSGINFYAAIQEKMKLKKGSEVLFAKANGKIHLADVTNHDRKRGYKLSYRTDKNDNILRTQTGVFVKAGLDTGIYEVTGWSEYDKQTGIEFFELLKISK